MGYKIVRIYRGVGMPNRKIKGGLTEAEAKAHCNDPKTRGTTKDGVDWFDGFELE
jgi:hypothetical protein